VLAEHKAILPGHGRAEGQFLINVTRFEGKEWCLNFRASKKIFFEIMFDKNPIRSYFQSFSSHFILIKNLIIFLILHAYTDNISDFHKITSINYISHAKANH